METEVEFDENFAVFQSALQLAHKIISRDVRHRPNKTESMEAICVVKEAINEVQAGLISPLAEAESIEILQRLIGSLIAKQLSQQGLRCKNVCHRYDSVLHGIPDFSFNFFIELILQCEWMTRILEVCSNEILDTGTQCEFIKNVFEGMFISKDPRMPSQLLIAVEHLLLRFNPILYQGTIDARITTLTVNEMMTVISRALRTLSSQEFTHNLEQINILSMCQVVFILSHVSREVYVTNASNHLLKLQPLTKNTNLSIHDLIQMETFPAPLQKANLAVDFKHRDGSAVTEDVIKSLCGSLSKGKITQILDFGHRRYIPKLNDDNFVEKYKVYGMCEAFYKNLERLSEVCSCPSDNIRISTGILGLLHDSLPPKSELLDRSENRIAGNDTDLNYLLDKAVHALSSKASSTAGRDWIEWLVNITDNHILSDPRWFNCLATNKSDFSSVDYVLKLVSRLHSVDSHHRQVVQKNVFDIFRVLNVKEKNAVLQDMYSSNSYQLDTECHEAFTSELTDTFNRMGSGSEVEDFTTEVAVSAAQLPIKVMEKIITEAINNKPQTSMMIEILKNLPALTKFKEERKFLLPKILKEYILDSGLERTRWQNCLFFVSKMYDILRHDPDGDGLSLMAEFIISVLLPQFDIKNPRDTINSLQLLNAILAPIMEESQSVVKDFASKVFPSEVSASCIIFLVAATKRTDIPPEDYDTFLELKDIGNTALCIIIKSIEAAGYTYDSKSWLYENIMEYDWTTIIRLKFIMDNDITVGIPSNVLDLLETDEGYVGFESQLPVMFNLLELSRVTELSEKSLRWTKLGDLRQLRVQAVFYMCQVMADAVNSDWIKAFRTIRLILRSNKDSNTSVGVELCSILTEVIYTLARGSTLSETTFSDDKWQHVSKCFITTLKECCLEDADDEDGSYFYDLFMNVCTMYVLVRDVSDCFDSVVVLTLNFLAKYEECINNAALCSHVAKQHDSDWRCMKTEINEMKRIVNRISTNNVKEPLMKKLEDIQSKTYS